MSDKSGSKFPPPGFGKKFRPPPASTSEHPALTGYREFAHFTSGPMEAARLRDEARMNMIHVIQKEVLPDFPFDEACELVDELKILGVSSKNHLKLLSAKHIDDLKTLPPEWKPMLSRNIAQMTVGRPPLYYHYRSISEGASSSGARLRDEATMNMIHVIQNQVLPDFPLDDACGLVDELKNLGVSSKNRLTMLSAEQIDELKTLSPLWKPMLSEYIAQEADLLRFVARMNMISVIRKEVLPDFPFDDACELVDELKILGVSSKVHLTLLSAKQIEELKTLPTVRKPMLSEYIEQMRLIHNPIRARGAARLRDEARMNMIHVIQKEVLPDFPLGDACELVDELKNLGVSSKKRLMMLSAEQIDKLETLPPVWKPMLSEYIDRRQQWQILWMERRWKAARDRDFDLTATLERKIKAKESQEHIIGPGGGSVEELGCKITFPPKALDKDTKFQTSVITDPSDSPEGKAPITPILECILDGDLKGTVQIEMQSWARPNRPQVKGRLYREDEGSSWKFVELVTLNSDGVVTFSTQHFTKFRVFMDAVSIAFGLVSSAYQGILTALGYTQLMTENFLHMNCDGVVAFICCLSHPKLIAAVRSSLIESGFIHPLLMPEPVVASSDGRLSVEISCSEPDNLRIKERVEDVETAQQKSERSVEVSVLSKKMKWQEYFLLRLESDKLFDYKGRIIMWFSVNGGKQQPISKLWPLKEKETPTVVQSTEVIAGTYVGPGGQMSETSKGGEKKVLVVKK